MMFAGQSGMNVFKWRSQNDLSLGAHLLEDGPPEIELSDYRKFVGSEADSPSGLLHGDGVKTEPISDLDIFFEQLYCYYREKGLRCIVVKWIVEILSVVFVEFFIWFFLLVVDWHALRNVKCGVDALESGSKPCDLAKEAIKEHPLVPFTFAKGVIVGSMVILTIYGLFNFLKFIVQFKSTLKVREFYYNSLHITDSEIQTTPWPSILDKVIKLQQSHRLCVVKDLSAHDIVMRMMRKENYLIAMLNKGVLALPVYWWVPGVGPAVKFKENGKKYNLILPKTLEWTLNWCIFQSMFDSKFCIQREFLANPSLLRKRLMFVGIGMFLISPCLVIFMLVYLFLRHAEQFYNHPSTASSRRWSNLSNWIFREFNEVEHLFRYRISNSILHASNYLKQFPAPLVTIVAKFISFVSGGLAAILIIIAFMDESLLEGHIFGRNLFWYAAIFGSVTAISRAAIADELQVLDHEGAMSLVVQYTHYMPKRWRGRENRASVLSEFESLFQYTGMMLLEEMVSIFLTPILLIFVVPKRVDDILHFISDYTVYIEGVGHVCSFSVFDFQSHGSRRYGSPYDAAKERRSSQGKMEKSFLSFQNTYSTWEPGEHGRQFLTILQNFMEKQINLDQLQGYPLFPTWQSTRGLRYQSELNHRMSARVPYDGFFPSNSRQVSGWLNLDSKTHPYILDWYYRLKPCDKIENSEDSTFPETSIFFEKNQELQGTRNKLPRETENEDESWELPYLSRLQGHLEASSSTSIFRNSISQDPRLQSHLEASTSSNLLRNSSPRGRDSDNHTINQWWARTGPNSSTMKASFLEPPNFGHQNYNHSNMAESTTQMQDYEHGGKLSSNLNNLSNTMYIGESDDDDGVLKLPFVDDYDGSFENFSVKVVPPSNDPFS